MDFFGVITLGYSVFFAAWLVRCAGKLLKSEPDSRIATVWLFFRSVLLEQFDYFDVADVLELQPPLASDGTAGATAESEVSYNLMTNLNTGDPFVRVLSQLDSWLMFMPFVSNSFNSCM